MIHCLIHNNNIFPPIAAQSYIVVQPKKIMQYKSAPSHNQSRNVNLNYKGIKDITEIKL